MLLLLLSIFRIFASQRNKIYAVSDSHIGVEALFPDHACAELWGLFDRLSAPDTDAKRLVINGDLVDHWLIPAHVMPPPYSSIISKKRCFGKSLSDKLNEVASNGVRIDVLVGNHDLELVDQDFVDAGVSGVTVHNIHADQKTLSSPVSGENWEIRHGHEFDLFNAPDYVEGLRPVGYYMSRCQASKTDPRYWSPAVFSHEQAQAAWDIGAQRNLVVHAELFLGVMLKGLTMGGECWNMSVAEGCWYRNTCEQRNITFGQAAEKHASIYERFYLGLELDKKL